MKSDQVQLLLLVGVTSVVAVGAVFVTALLSIFVVFLLKSAFALVVQLVAFVCEVVVAVVAAITSGTTVTLSIVAAAGASAVTFPASSIQARVGVSMAVSAAAIVASATAVLYCTTLRVDAEIAVAVVSAAAMSVAFAAAWAVGVMSLIEKETQHAGLKMTSILDTVRRNNYRILRLMLKFQSGSKGRELDIALLHSVKAGYKECAKVLLEAGANPDARDSYDNTPLLVACETGCYDIAKLLVDGGAGVGLQHAGGRGTALHQAANWGSDECVRLLLSKSANPNAVDGLWRTPLMLAAAHAHAADTVLRTLVVGGSDVNAAGGPERRTALHYAAARGLDPSALLDAGADAAAVDAAGNTPLHVAAASGHGHLLRVLLGRSDPTAANDQGRTPLHLAAGRGDVDCLGAIVDRAGPAACSAVDAGGHLPVWLAAVNGHYQATVFFVRINGPFVGPRNGRAAVGDREESQNSVTSTAASPTPTSPLEAALDKCHVGVARALLIGGCEGRAAVSDWLVGVRERSGAWLDDNVEVVDWLDRFAHAPCELGHMCRLTIRAVLGARVGDAVPRLLLPKKLQQFVLMEEL